MVARVKVGMAATLVVAAAALVGAEKAKISVNVNEKFSFAGPRTYAWAEPSGELRFQQVVERDPEQLRRRIDPDIIGPISAELNARGYTAAPRDQADLVANYYLLVGPNISSQYMGQFVASVPEWGLPPFAGATQSYEVYEQGSLVVDLLSTERKTVVWRGVIQAKVRWERTDAQRREALTGHIRDLFKKFPVKPAKK
jgi:hypothetical protein